MTSPIAGRDAVVHDDQIVVGVERQVVGVERPLGLLGRSVSASAKAPANVPERGQCESGGGDGDGPS